MRSASVFRRASFGSVRSSHPSPRACVRVFDQRNVPLLALFAALRTLTLAAVSHRKRVCD